MTKWGRAGILLLRMHWTLHVPELPVPQPRVKASRRGEFIHIYTPARAEKFKKAVRASAKDNGLRGRLLEGPVSVTVVCLLPRPKSHFTKRGLRPSAPLWHTKRSDVDNYAKGILDALTREGVWKDDGQVAELAVRKVYTADAPRAVIQIKNL
jgi:Holliday junction resolvase RusA-like endonuclease